MPHSGKPSRACKNCKQRHVRCDETRPSCNRCVKSNRICPGYTEGLDLVLRDQNAIAKAGVGRREKAARNARIASESSQSRSESSSRAAYASSYSSSSSSSSTGSTAVTPRPSYLAPSEEDYQLCLFVDTYVLYPHDAQTDCGFLQLLPVMYSSTKLKSPLALCVAAIAGALSTKFVYKMRDVELPKVRQKYTTALTATIKTLEDPVESLTDETLMAVCLLGFYEAVVASFRGLISSARHFDGAAALIKQRQGRMTTELAQRLLLGVRNNIIYRAVAHATPIDTSSSIWKDYDTTPHTAATLIDQLSLEIPNLMIAASKSNTPDPDPTYMPEAAIYNKASIVNRAIALDAKLSTWPAAVPATWVPARVSIERVPASIRVNGFIYQDYCEIYHDIMVGSTWNSYRVSRLKVLAIIARLAPQASADHASTVKTIQDIADEICASVPFCMGNRVGPAPLYSLEAEYPTIDETPAKEYHHRTAAAFGGWHVLRPMKEVMAVGMWLRPGQMAWVGMQLQRLANVYDVEPEDD